MPNDTDAPSRQAQAAQPVNLPPEEMLVVNEIMRQLRERKPHVRKLIASLVLYCGAEIVIACLEETLAIESSGGMMTANGTRRRTPGGDVPAPDAPAHHLRSVPRDISRLQLSTDKAKKEEGEETCRRAAHACCCLQLRAARRLCRFAPWQCHDRENRAGWSPRRC
ncbi:MAG: hypothetical protein HC828_13700 [Blastochloris sp.]|nr:hypothetical protein [Blastochloris sp.]